MKIEIKKIIAKEILILFLCLITIILIWISLNINNSYQKYNQENINININSITSEIDFIDNKISNYNRNINKFKKEIFYQLCKIDGGIISGKYEMPNVNNNYENIGEDKLSDDIFKEFGGKKIYYDFLNISSNKKHKKFKIINEIGLPIYHENNFINEKEFFRRLTNSPKYRIDIFNKLKANYNSSKCKSVYEFELLTGIKKQPNINHLIEIVKNKKIRLKSLNNNYSKSIKYTFSITEINNIIIKSIIYLFSIAFLMRYSFFVLKWSINTLKLKQ